MKNANRYIFSIRLPGDYGTHVPSNDTWDSPKNKCFCLFMDVIEMSGFQKMLT